MHRKWEKKTDTHARTHTLITVRRNRCHGQPQKASLGEHHRNLQRRDAGDPLRLSVTLSARKGNAQLWRCATRKNVEYLWSIPLVFRGVSDHNIVELEDLSPEAWVESRETWNRFCLFKPQVIKYDHSHLEILSMLNQSLWIPGVKKRRRRRRTRRRTRRSRRRRWRRSSWGCFFVNINKWVLRISGHFDH